MRASAGTGSGIVLCAALALTASLLAGCKDDHPNWSRYEYRYANGQFVPPYETFPSGRERADWECFDGKTRRAFECTFVRGGWEEYQFIYRRKG